LAAVTEPAAIARYQIAAGKASSYITHGLPLGRVGILRDDYDRLRASIALLESVDAITPLGQQDEDGYALLETCLKRIAEHAKPPVVLAWALQRWLSHEGLGPSWDVCAASGAALTETPAWVAPSAGGHVKSAFVFEYADRIQVEAETLIGLARLGELEAPPDHLRRTGPTLSTLVAFLEHHAHRALKACRAIAADC
jgi:DNA repair protein RecO